MIELREISMQVKKGRQVGLSSVLRWNCQLVSSHRQSLSWDHRASDWIGNAVFGGGVGGCISASENLKFSTWWVREGMTIGTLMWRREKVSVFGSWWWWWEIHTVVHLGLTLTYGADRPAIYLHDITSTSLQQLEFAGVQLHEGILCQSYSIPFLCFHI